jgi:hypothetical protein
MTILFGSNNDSFINRTGIACHAMNQVLSFGKFQEDINQQEIQISNCS